MRRPVETTTGLQDAAQRHALILAGGEPGTAESRPGPPPWRAALTRWTPLLPALVTLAVVTWRIQVPSFWRDEAATLSAAHRSFPALMGMLGHVDAVHGAYYALMWAVVRLGGSGELAVRFPSALAMAAAAGIITAVGRRVTSPRAGLAAGLVFAALPPVSWFGQDARPFAIETALACAATYVFVRVLDCPSGRERRRWLGAYAVAVVLLGVVNLFGLLLVPAHGLTLALSRGHRAPPALARDWGIAVGAAAAAMIPFALLDWTQRGQISWLHTPVIAALASLGRLTGTRGPGLAAVTILVCSLMVSALSGRLRVDWPARLPALCLPWVVLPPAILLAMSALRPVYTFRYIVFCIPAVALLIGAGLAAAGRAAGSAGLVLLVLLALPAQLGERGPAGHGDGIRQLDQIVAGQRHPGDAVLYLGSPGTRTFADAYPFGLAHLRDIALGRSPAQTGTLSGTDVPAATVRSRLTGISRVWVVEADGTRPPQPDPVLAGSLLRVVRTWRVTDIWLRLYTVASPTALYRTP